MGPFVSRHGGGVDSSALEACMVGGDPPATSKGEGRVVPITPSRESLMGDGVASCIPLPDLDRGALPFGFSGNTHADSYIVGGSVLSLGLKGGSPTKLDGCYSPDGDDAGGEEPGWANTGTSSAVTSIPHPRCLQS